MKNNFGITLVELVAVIVILLIIATAAINSGIQTLDEADVTEIFVEMTSIKTAIEALQLKKELDVELKEYDELVEILSGDNTIWGIDNKQKYDENRDIEIRKTLGLDSLNHTYEINISTGDVSLKDEITIRGLKVRTYDEVRKLAEK